MLHLLKKLTLYTELGPGRVHKVLISIQIKIYWSFVDYQHLQKYFYNFNINTNIFTLNYCFVYKMSIRGNFIWKFPWSGYILEIYGSIWYGSERKLFLKKGHQKFHPLPYSIPVLSVLHRNKALYNFHKRGQHLIVECNIGLEYVLW